MEKTSSNSKYKHLGKVEKEILNCISCGDCREATDSTSIPQKWGVCVARENTSGFEPFFSRGKMQIIRSVWENKLGLSKDLAEVIFQCPTCNACAKTCPYKIDNVALYEALRAELCDAGCGLEPHAAMNAMLAETSNPYGKDNKQKGDWLSGLDFEVKLITPGGSDLLYFVGCTAALTPEVRSVATSTARVLHALGVNFTVLGGKEVCCGSVALRTGNRRVFNIVASKNKDLIKSAGIKTIITSCAGCYRTLKLDYAEILKDLDVKILHTVEYIHGLIKEKGIQLPRLDKVVTYHDPCHAGRHLGLYEPPREILNQIATLKEMKSIKEYAKCCGAGGGVKKAFPELALKIARSRLKEAEETGASIIVSICPFCERGLSDAIKATNSKLQVVDLLELVLQSLSSTSKVAVRGK